VCGIEYSITKSRVDETVNILRGIRKGKKRKPKLRTSEHGITGMMCNVKRRGVKTAMKEYKKTKTGNVCINVTLRRVRLNTVVV
jgi:hypothetical protein